MSSKCCYSGVSYVTALDWHDATLVPSVCGKIQLSDLKASVYPIILDNNIAVNNFRLTEEYSNKH